MRRAAPDPHVELGEDFALAVSTLGEVGEHAHAAPALVMGLNGTFGYRDGGGASERSALVIPPGRRHRLACGTTRMLTLYPLRLGAELTRLEADLESLEGLRRAAMAASEGANSSDALGAAVHALTTGMTTRLDPRLLRAVDLLKREGGASMSLEAMAEAIHLSPSRLMHLFRANLGVPFRQLRSWERMRRATEARAGGDSLTHAGLAAGFADASHFSHAFRKMFGVSASTVLGKGATVRCWRDDQARAGRR